MFGNPPSYTLIYYNYNFTDKVTEFNCELTLLSILKWFQKRRLQIVKEHEHRLTSNFTPPTLNSGRTYFMGGGFNLSTGPRNVPWSFLSSGFSKIFSSCHISGSNRLMFQRQTSSPSSGFWYSWASGLTRLYKYFCTRPGLMVANNPMELKFQVFWEVTQCHRVCSSRHFEETWCLHLHGYAGQEE
jgi:hypothetical protein